MALTKNRKKDRTGSNLWSLAGKPLAEELALDLRWKWSRRRHRRIHAKRPRSRERVDMLRWNLQNRFERIEIMIKWCALPVRGRQRRCVTAGAVGFHELPAETFVGRCIDAWTRSSAGFAFAVVVVIVVVIVVAISLSVFVIVVVAGDGEGETTEHQRSGSQKATYRGRSGHGFHKAIAFHTEYAAGECAAGLYRQSDRK